MPNLKRSADALRKTIAAEDAIEAGLPQLAHDVQSCLHLIGLRTELLKATRNDEAKFAKICAAIDEDRREAARLITEYLRFVRARS